MPDWFLIYLKKLEQECKGKRARPNSELVPLIVLRFTEDTTEKIDHFSFHTNTFKATDVWKPFLHMIVGSLGTNKNRS